MLLSLFGLSWLPSLLIVIIIAFGFFAAIGKEGVKIACLTILVFAVLGLAGYACYSLNEYYSASGGVFGNIGSVFKKPTVTIEKTLESTKYNFDNIVLKQEFSDKENHYSTTIKSDETFVLSGNDYIVFINDTPLRTEIFNNSISAYFNNAFFDENNNVKIEDTLKIDFFFYKEYTNIKISSEGGLKAYGHWLKYFERENFEIEVKKIENAYNPDADMCKVMFVSDAENSKILEFKKGSEIKLPVIEKVGYENIGWSYTKGGSKINASTIKISNNLVLYGIYEERLYEVKFSSRGEILNTQNVGRNDFPKAPTITDEKFYGWSENGSDLVDINSVKIKKNTTFIALYKNYVDITSSAENGTSIYGSANENKASIRVEGLKAGDKIKVVASSILVMDGREFAGGSPNSIYGWSFIGSDENHAWHENLSNSDMVGNGTLTISTNNPITSEVGRIDYYDKNQMTFYVVCEKDNYLTIKWESTVKFYVETMMLEQIFVLR